MKLSSPPAKLIEKIFQEFVDAQINQLKYIMKTYLELCKSISSSSFEMQVV